MKKLLFISGARPNIIKIAPLYKILNKNVKYECKILHSNQHSNKSLYKNIYKNLGLPLPHFKIKKYSTNNRLDLLSYFIKSISLKINVYKPNLIILFGDVDTTLAAGIVARKSGIKTIHIESGLRSKDFNAQEEINRRVVDHLSDINFATSPEAFKNLVKEGLKKKSHYVGNIIFDNYFNLKKKIISSKILENLNIFNNYILVTMHRYQTIDNKKKLLKFINTLNKLSKKNKILFSCHTRTKKNLIKYNLFNRTKKITTLLEPLTYTDFTNLLINSNLVITDSGGVQEECLFHNKKCLVLRDEFERKSFLRKNLILKANFNNIHKLIYKKYKNKKSYKPDLWDGKVSNRINLTLKKYFDENF